MTRPDDGLAPLIAAARVILARPPIACAHFRPDHNGECQTCDEWADAHDDAAPWHLLRRLVAALESAPTGT